MFEADCQRSVALSVYNIVINVLLQKIENREKELFFTSVMQRSSLVDVDDVDVQVSVGE
jgi:hypothetical protein